MYGLYCGIPEVQGIKIKSFTELEKANTNVDFSVFD